MADGFDENLVDAGAEQGAAESANTDPTDTNAEPSTQDLSTSLGSDQIQSGQEEQRGAPDDVKRMVDKVHQHFGLTKEAGIEDVGGNAPKGPEATETPTGTTWTGSPAAIEDTSPRGGGTPGEFADLGGNPTVGDIPHPGERWNEAMKPDSFTGQQPTMWEGIKKMLMGDGAATPLELKQQHDDVMRRANEIDAGRQNRPGIWTKDEVVLQNARDAQKKSDAEMVKTMQGYRDQHTTFRGIGHAALDKGDRDSAARLFDEAMKHVPDGKTVTTVPGKDGFIVTVRSPSNDPDTIGTPANDTAQTYRLTDNQMRDMLAGPAGQFDTLIYHGIENSLKGAASRPGRLGPGSYMPADEAIRRATQPYEPAGAPNTGGGRSGETELERIRRYNPGMTDREANREVAAERTYRGQESTRNIPSYVQEREQREGTPTVFPRQRSDAGGLAHPSSMDQAREDVRANQTPTRIYGEHSGRIGYMEVAPSNGGRRDVGPGDQVDPRTGRTFGPPRPPEASGQVDPRTGQPSFERPSINAPRGEAGFTTRGITERVNQGEPNIPVPGRTAVSPQQQKLENAARAGDVTLPADRRLGTPEAQVARDNGQPAVVRGGGGFNPIRPGEPGYYGSPQQQRENPNYQPKPGEQSSESLRVQWARRQDQLEQERQAAHERAVQKKQQPPPQAPQRVYNPGQRPPHNVGPRSRTARNRAAAGVDPMTGQKPISAYAEGGPVEGAGEYRRHKKTGEVRWFPASQ